MRYYRRVLTTSARSLTTAIARGWARWKVIARVIGTFQARVLLSLFYFVIVPPFALAMKFAKDPLRLAAHRGSTGWIERPAREISPESAGRQF